MCEMRGNQAWVHIILLFYYVYMYFSPLKQEIKTYNATKTGASTYILQFYSVLYVPNPKQRPKSTYISKQTTILYVFYQEITQKRRPAPPPNAYTFLKTRTISLPTSPSSSGSSGSAGTAGIEQVTLYSVLPEFVLITMSSTSCNKPLFIADTEAP